MDESGSRSSILDTLRPAGLALSLNGRPFRQSQDERWSIRDAVFKDYDLFVCYGGSAEFSLAGNTYALSEGSALLCPPGVAVRARKTSADNFRAIAQHFELKIAGVADFFDLIEYESFVKLSDWSATGPLYERFVDLHDVPRAALIRDGLFSAVLFSFLRDAFVAERSGTHERFRFVFGVAGRIEREMAREDAVERALADVPYSRDYAVRMFRKRFGVPPKEYLIRCRMNAARDYLLSGRSVKETAAAVGYVDELYFSRLFAAREGIGPREFRKRNGAGLS